MNDNTGELLEGKKASQEAILGAIPIKRLERGEFQHLQHVPQPERPSELRRLRNIANATRRLEEIARGK